jgi:hypothetical protein
MVARLIYSGSYHSVGSDVRWRTEDAMWPFIPSRVRSALTAVAVILTGALVVTAMVFAVNRALPSQIHTYQSYQLAVTPSAPWHPGQSLSLQWVPIEEEVSPDAPPTSIMCQFSLYGPYATRADAQADHSPQEDGTTLADSAPPLALSTALGAPAPPPVAYVLPVAVTPGYYVAVSAADLGDIGGGGSSLWVVTVAA